MRPCAYITAMKELGTTSVLNHGLQAKPKFGISRIKLKRNVNPYLIYLLKITQPILCTIVLINGGKIIMEF